ncbi:MAG: AI-2E family transporter [archaeon]
MDDTYFRKIMTAIVLIVLVVLSFFLVKPILLAIIVGLILAFIFYPIYCKINKRIKLPNLSASIMSFLLILIILLPLWFLTPIVIDQSIKFFVASQQINFVESLREMFPSLFSSEQLIIVIENSIDSFISKSLNSIGGYISIDNIMRLFFNLIVVFFTFFFVLRDKEKLSSYIKSLSPFPKEIEEKLFDSSKTITSAVIYGQIVIGIVQGLILGAGLFIFNVPNASLLTALACLAGVFPVVGTSLVWIPVLIYLFIEGYPFSTFGILIFGIISSSVDNFMRPIFVSKRTKMNSLVILLGMIGGLFLFGVLGFILGPLILAYLLIISELYRNKKISDILIHSGDSCSR